MGIIEFCNIVDSRFKSKWCTGLGILTCQCYMTNFNKSSRSWSLVGTSTNKRTSKRGKKKNKGPLLTKTTRVIQNWFTLDVSYVKWNDIHPYNLFLSHYYYSRKETRQTFMIQSRSPQLLIIVLCVYKRSAVTSYAATVILRVHRTFKGFLVKRKTPNRLNMWAEILGWVLKEGMVKCLPSIKAFGWVKLQQAMHQV